MVVDFLKIGSDYWLSIHPRVARELREWSRHAATIPDPTLRHQALRALREKRSHAEGAAAFAVLAPRRARGRVVRFLVAFQVMYDYLDTVSEQPGADPLHDTMQLHTALTDALMPEVAPGAAYALHPQQEDGGYLSRFIATCRCTSSSLPAFPAVASRVQSAARVATRSQGYNHALPAEPPAFVTEVVVPWAAAEGGDVHGLTWWEVIGATGSSLAILVLVAAAADPSLRQAETQAIHNVYFPWGGAVLALVDSLVDQERDAAEATHGLVSRYPSSQAASERVAGFTRQALRLTESTSQPERHALILASMIALFAASPQARRPPASAPLRSALHTTGARGLLPLAALRCRNALASWTGVPRRTR